MISEIRLRNFKCFESLELPLGPLTLLSGTNSAGKSSVLQALLLLRQSHLHNQLKPGAVAVLNGELIQLGNADTTIREGAGLSPLDIALTWSDGLDVGWRLAPGDRVEDLCFEDGPASNDWNGRPPLDRCRYVSADRIGPRVAFPTSDILVRTARDVGARGEYVAHYLSVHGDEVIPNDSLHFVARDMGVDGDDAASRKLLHEVEAWLGLLVPGVRIGAVLVETHSAVHVVPRCVRVARSQKRRGRCSVSVRLRHHRAVLVGRRIRPYGECAMCKRSKLGVGAGPINPKLPTQQQELTPRSS